MQTRLNLNTMRTNETKEERTDRSKMQADHKASKTYMSVKERELLWDNYMLGKRIL